MLITPVQPNNSLNNLIPTRPTRPSQKPDSKPLDVVVPAKKTVSLARKNVRARGGTTQSLARKKLLLELKLQESLRKNGQKLQSIEEHKEDLMQRKQMLAEILKEYEQISKDKNVLTAEIRNMKKYLSDIRSKLDQSLTVLNKNTTLFAMKRGLTNHILNGSNTKNKRLKKPRKSILQGKDSNVRGVLKDVKFK